MVVESGPPAAARSRWRTPFQLILALVGLASVVVALYQAGGINKQLRQQVSVEQGAIDQQLLAAIREIDTMFVTSPELRPFFYERRVVPRRGQLRSRVLAAAERLLDTADAVASARRHDLLATEDWDDWKAAIHSYYADSPALKAVWKSYSEFYSDETRQLLEGL